MDMKTNGSFIQNILNNCGMSNIWLNQNGCSSVWLSSSVEQKLKDQFFQEWSEYMNSTSKGLCYRIFKTELKIEKYISILPYNYMNLIFVNLDEVVTDYQ